MLKLKKRTKRISAYPHVCRFCDQDIPAHSRCLEEWYEDEHEALHNMWVCRDCELARIRFDLFGMSVWEYQEAINGLCNEHGLPDGAFPDRVHALILETENK